MKISEAITQLEAIKAEHGDLLVGREYDGTCCFYGEHFAVYRVGDEPFLQPYGQGDVETIEGVQMAAVIGNK